MYRYTNVTGKRVCIYARTLEDLRVKEQTIQKELNDGIDYAAGKATVIDLVERYVGLKQGPVTVQKSSMTTFSAF